MELYTLDSQLRRSEVIESYESMIWTERYADIGDFQLDIATNVADKSLYTNGTKLAIDKSERVMVVQTVQDSVNNEGMKMLTITGPSLESILEERINKYDDIKAGTPATPLILGPNLPAAMIRELFVATCISNDSFNNADRIPFIQDITGYIEGMIPEPVVTPTIQASVEPLFTTIQTIANLYRLGFRLVRRADDSKLYFEVYTGYDRTSAQTTYPAVVFSSTMDSLTNTKEVVSTAGLKNIAYVFAPNGSRVVYGEGASAATLGFERKVLIVDASDIEDAAGPTLNYKLDQRGQEELSKNRTIIGFDGEMSQTNELVYGVDYMLGDLVEQRSEDGIQKIMKVTEQIFTSDKEGEKSYPTLALDTLIVAGAWDSISPTKTWDSYTTENWDSM